MRELGQGGRRGLGPPTRKAGQAREHRVGLFEPDVLNLPAVPRMPAERGPPELPRLVHEQEHELQGVRKADEVELGRRRERDRRVATVERSTKTAVGRPLRGHERMFAQDRLGENYGTPPAAFAA